ncbi:MAG: hypothetical protein IJH07_03275 [Ruminococcus sp.]|nr:hypothetical protein [Ruminococcus sp.]
MKSLYERTSLVITAFETDDVIVTSGETSHETLKMERENAYGSFGSFQSPQNAPGSWF